MCNLYVLYYYSVLVMVLYYRNKTMTLSYIFCSKGFPFFKESVAYIPFNGICYNIFWGNCDNIYLRKEQGKIFSKELFDSLMQLSNIQLVFYIIIFINIWFSIYRETDIHLQQG